MTPRRHPAPAMFADGSDLPLFTGSVIPCDIPGDDPAPAASQLPKRLWGWAGTLCNLDNDDDTGTPAHEEAQA